MFEKSNKCNESDVQDLRHNSNALRVEWLEQSSYTVQWGQISTWLSLRVAADRYFFEFRHIIFSKSGQICFKIRTIICTADWVEFMQVSAQLSLSLGVEAAASWTAAG